MEIWKPIPSSPRYEVSNLGRVRNGPRILHVRSNGKGYMRTELGAKRSVYIHAIVAETFLGPRPKGAEVDHIDFNRANNAATNLQYLTVKENRRKTFTAGRGRVPTTEQKVRGERQGSAKLTKELVEQIRMLGAVYKFKKTALASLYGISVCQVFRILSSKHWKHV